jgi:hypothetical protein
MVINAADLRGYEPAALWSDLNFNSTRSRAARGDGDRQRRRLESPAGCRDSIFEEPVRHFGASRLAEAKDWVRSQ